MSQESKPRNIVRTAFLSIWGLVTLILVFTVSLLIGEMMWQGQTPLGLALGTDVEVVMDAKPTAPVQSVHEVEIYFASRTESKLLTETRRMDLGSSTVENCRTALSYLIDGPTQPALAPIVSNKTRVRGIYLLENRELVIDFSRDLEAGQIKSASAELLMVQGIVDTMCQSSLKGEYDLGVRSVRFLFEGAPYQHSFPAHIDLSSPVYPSIGRAAMTGQSAHDV